MKIKNKKNYNKMKIKIMSQIVCLNKFIKM